MKNEENLILLTDSYKECHHRMDQEGTENIYSYFESRNGAKYPYTQFFGLQFILKKYFEGSVISPEDIDEAEEFCNQHFATDGYFDRPVWEHVVKEHEGRLPLRIKAVPEGMVIPISNILMSAEVTDDKCASLTNFFETILTHVWYPSNVATIGYNLKEVFNKAFERTSSNQELLPFMLHDFGFRGVNCVEGAGIGGSAHLVNFMGTDTIHGITYAKRYYDAGMAGFSVAASEHRVMTALGKQGEMQITKQLIKKYPKGILSVVADSYNIEKFIQVCGDWEDGLKQDILAREGKFVIRPDSPRFQGDKACNQILWLAQRLGHLFGEQTNNKGYKVLNPKIGMIYGDGLSADEIIESVNMLMNNGYSAETCVFGMGGGLLQKHNRDTQRNAFKCSAQKRQGIWYDVYKDPLDKTKASKRGRLALIKDGEQFLTIKENDGKYQQDDILQVVFENGTLLKDWSFDQVKKNAEI